MTDILTEARHKANDWPVFDKTSMASSLIRCADEIERLRDELAQWRQMHMDSYARNTSALVPPR